MIHDDEVPTRAATRNRKRQAERKGPKPPRKATPEYLERAALYYLERYASSAENLRRILLRKVERSARAHDTGREEEGREEGAKAVDSLVERMIRAGLLNDRAYAEARVVTLHRAGQGVQAIRARLLAKGVDDDTIAAALERLHEEAAEPELAAALRYARRRRLGPYRMHGRADNRQRDLAALARKGFSLDLARRVVDVEELAELEAEADIQPGPLG